MQRTLFGSICVEAIVLPSVVNAVFIIDCFDLLTFPVDCSMSGTVS